MQRISKDKYYLNIAYQVANRSTCLRRCYGAVIVKNDEIISSGYNGSPRDRVNCSNCGVCLRDELNIAHGSNYELCRAVHAEQNAIISAKRSDMIDSTLYLAGFDPSTHKQIFNCSPCKICERMIVNAGIKEVITYSDGLDVRITPTYNYSQDAILPKDFVKCWIKHYLKEVSTEKYYAIKDKIFELMKKQFLIVYDTHIESNCDNISYIVDEAYKDINTLLKFYKIFNIKPENFKRIYY